jgi:F-type H+-transporting ATPase subunit gamma
VASAELRIINRRIKSVRSTKKITRAMELIASSRIVKAQNRMKASEAYFVLLSEIVQDLINNGSIPKVEIKDGKERILLIVITSDRGLAGAYNTNILRIADNRRKEIEQTGKDVEIVTVGKKATRYFTYRKIDVSAGYEGITDSPEFNNALSVMKPITDKYYTGEVSSIEIVYTSYKSALTQNAVIKKILPLEPQEIENKSSVTFEPSAVEVLNSILPKYANASFFNALLNGSTSEHAARMRAMKAATDNAEELIKVLAMKSNQARQAEITTEISEIVGGSEALSDAS